MPSYSALIPLRGGSKSIPHKNIKEIAGYPLCYWTLSACVKAGFFEEVIVSTDSIEISNVVHSLGLPVKIIARPGEFATDEASTESVMLHAMASVSSDVLVTIQATSPLLSALDLISGRQLFESNCLDSLLSAVRVKRFFWTDDSSPYNYNPLNRPRRQEFVGTLMENGAFYFTKLPLLADKKCRLGGKIGIFEMSEECAVELDESSDWPIVEKLLLSSRCRE